MGKNYDVYGEDYFWGLYKKGDIVFPSAVSRYFSETQKAAYERCEERLSIDLKHLYLIKCPCCGKAASSERFYSIPNINTDEEIGCIHCDNEFIPNLENDITVQYEKM